LIDSGFAGTITFDNSSFPSADLISPIHNHDVFAPAVAAIDCTMCDLTRHVVAIECLAIATHTGMRGGLTPQTMRPYISKLLICETNGCIVATLMSDQIRFRT